MNNKTWLLLATILLIALPNFASSLAVTVGDNQPWNKYAFSSSFSFTLYANETVSYYFQYTGTNDPNIYFYAPDGTLITTQSCSGSPCSGSFAQVTDAGLYSMTIMPPGGFINNLAGPVPVAEVNIFGNSNLRSTNILIQETLVLYYARMHKIYVSADSITLIVTAQNLVADQITYINNNALYYISVWAEGNLNELATDYYSIAATPSGANLVYSFALGAAGYYWIVVDVTLLEGMGATDTPAQLPSTITDTYTEGWTYSISYSTDRYQCPYDESYPDITNIYQGCLFPVSVNTFPCLVFDNNLQKCSQCINGYTLSAGVCLENNCTAGQYKHYGVCYALPANCLNYNPVLGCLSCVDNTYQITNKTCVRIPLNCTGRTYYDSVKYVCANVSALCNTFDSLNGNCLTCASAANQVVNGSCVPIPVPICQQRQYALNGVCYNVDSLCSTFQFIGGKCLTCVQGFKIVNGVCTQIQCPNRYVPDVYGNCKQVSPLCKVYNQFGFCLNCTSGHSVDSTGQCLQQFAPYPCPARQYLGIDNQCHVNQYCNATNPWDNSCASCSAGYYLLYTGQCVVKVVCKQRQFIINNVCYNVSTTCGNYNQTTGKCLNCVSENYQLYFGLCIPTSGCGNRQWTDAKGVCHDVSSSCSSFNPTTGACIDCISDYTNYKGICCQPNYYPNSKGICVAGQAPVNNFCTIYDVSMGCLECQTGHNVSYQSSNGLGICV